MRVFGKSYGEIRMSRSTIDVTQEKSEAKGAVPVASKEPFL